MLRAVVISMLLSACAPPVERTFVLTVMHLGDGRVTGPSGEYEPVFSPGWVRTSAERLKRSPS